MSPNHKHFDSREKIFLICHVISLEDMLKALCEFMSRTFLRKVTIWWPITSRDIKY